MTEVNRANVRMPIEEHDLTVATRSSGAFSIPFGAQCQSPNTTGSLGCVIRNDCAVGLGLMLPSSIASLMPEAHGGLSIRIEEQSGEMHFFGADTPDEIISLMRARRREQATSLAESPDPATYERPQSVTSRDAADILQSHDPRSTLYLTGAGISARSVWTHQMLTKRIGFTQGVPTMTTATENIAFAQGFVADPFGISHTSTMINQLINQKRAARPTPAHIAFSSIMQRFDDVPLAGTLNIDKCHERTRLRVPTLGWPWPEAISLSGGDEQLFVSELQRRLARTGISLIVAIGLGDDSKELFKYIRQGNNQATILACNTAAPGELPYTNAADFHLQDDVQSSLPAVFDAL